MELPFAGFDLNLIKLQTSGKMLFGKLSSFVDLYYVSVHTRRTPATQAFCASGSALSITGYWECSLLSFHPSKLHFPSRQHGRGNNCNVVVGGGNGLGLLRRTRSRTCKRPSWKCNELRICALLGSLYFK